MIRRFNRLNRFNNRRFEALRHRSNPLFYPDDVYDDELDTDIQSDREDYNFEIDTKNEKESVIKMFINFLKKLINNIYKLRPTNVSFDTLRLFADFGWEIFEDKEVRRFVKSQKNGEVFESKNGPGDNLFIIPININGNLIESNFEHQYKGSDELCCVPVTKGYGAFPYYLIPDYRDDKYVLIVNFFFGLDVEAD